MWPAGEPSIRTRHVALSSGQRIRVVESGGPAGAAVLLVPGWGACVYSYSEMMPALSAAGYRAFAMDLPGMGLSDRPALADAYTTEAICRAVAETAKQLALDRYTFVGHSMGGAIGLQLVLTGDPSIARLVLLNSVGLGRAPFMRPVRLLSPRLIEPLLPRLARRLAFKLILDLAFGTQDRPTPEDIDQYWAPTQFPGMLRACRLLAHRFDFGALSDAQLARVTVPVLVVASERDRMVFATAERARLVPNARVLSLANAGHLALQECAEQVNRAMLGFLRDNPA